MKGLNIPFGEEGARQLPDGSYIYQVGLTLPEQAVLGLFIGIVICFVAYISYKCGLKKSMRKLAEK